MKLHRLFIWLLAMGYGVLVYANEENASSAHDPFALRQEALRDFESGKAEDAQRKLIAAYELFIETKNWDMASMCLYERAIDYMNMGDWENMLVQQDALESLYEQHNSPMVAYNYHSVASGYYSYMDSIDLALEHGRRAIVGLEQIADPRSYNIVPAWSYYNMAFFYDMYFQPPMVDSVRHYLGRARASVIGSRSRKDSLEALISIVDLEAWQEYYEHDYREAEAMMHEVLAMIDTVAQESPNTIITERAEAYEFLAMMAEEQGKWQAAYGYQQQLTETNAQRYDVDKRRVLQEVQTQYEVEKKELRLAKLEAENQSHRWLLVALWLLLLLLVIGYWLLVMGRKNAEAKLYEAALEADNMRQAISVLEEKTDIEPLRLLVDGLVKQMQEVAKRDYTEPSIMALQALDLAHIQVLLSHGTKITTMDKRYILCFAAGMTVEQIADFMCLEPASVYTVRYRLRKKFGSEYPFPY